MEIRVPVPVHLGMVLEGLARNPALPPALLRRLLARPSAARDEALMWRTDLTEELAGEIIALGDATLTHSLACNRDIPAEVKRTLAAAPDPAVRSALAAHEEGMPPELFGRFVSDPAPEVREEAAMNDGTPDDLRARLAHDPHPKVRAALGQFWTDAPEAVRRSLLTDPDPTVRAAACATYFRGGPPPAPPADLHPALLADPVTRAGVVRHLTLDAGTARRLAADESEEVRAAVAGHPALPAGLRDALGRDEDALVRAEVFYRQDTPDALRAEIHENLEAGAGRAKDTPWDATDDDGFCYMAVLDMRHRHVVWPSRNPLDHAGSPYACFRRSVATAGSLPPEIVARLLDDEDHRVRATMAARIPDLDPAVAERLERTHIHDLKHPGGPAEHVTFPPATLRRFATDPESGMRALAPRDPDLPAELAGQLAADADPSVRRAVAAHRNLPAPARLALLADEDGLTARAAARSPFLPVDAMEELLARAGL
ncbi:hypothetical protein IPZ58_31735 [Streptomyces roseoverticillatus]|uniref:hypothetical protein n=1 Tax=Streptomyces roseoverticillatus TaxID=66429 RepID=UPI001F2A243A|nr:hypothetical protein [Streptomyces roseoverticillatus]MCF3106108.1 hypothetical protein [Streptomyces roseoverticillatus]